MKRTGRGSARTRTQSVIANPFCGCWSGKVMAWRCMMRARTLERLIKLRFAARKEWVLFWFPWGAAPVFWMPTFL